MQVNLIDVWEPYTGTSHRLPKPVSRKQLDNRVTERGRPGTLGILSGWISSFGCPHTITTDQGRQFESQLFHSLAKLCGIRLSRVESVTAPPSFDTLAIAQDSDKELRTLLASDTALRLEKQHIPGTTLYIYGMHFYWHAL
jgi:hypothetical protein